MWRTRQWLATFVFVALTGVGSTHAFGLAGHQDANARDGSHDFGFDIGVWHTHIQRMVDPLSSASETLVLNGTVTVRKIWGGRAQLEEIEADGPKGHWEGLSLFLYNPKARQWSQSFINSQRGELGSPLIGEFHDRRGELFGQDTFKGTTVLVRGVWSKIEPNAHRYEESYSDDGGKTWKEAFTAALTRDEPAPAQDGSVRADPPAGQASVAGQQDFDFDLGTWRVHSTRLMHPLTGSHDWVEMDETTVVKKVWTRQPRRI